MLQDFNCGSLHILALMCAIHCASGFPIGEGKYGQDCAGVLSNALQRACQVQGVFPFSRTVDLCSQEPFSCSNGRLLVWPLCLCLYGVHRSRENPIKRCIFSNQHWPLAKKTPPRAHACSRHPSRFHCIDLLSLELRGRNIFAPFLLERPGEQTPSRPELWRATDRHSSRPWAGRSTECSAVYTLRCLYKCCIKWCYGGRARNRYFFVTKKGHAYSCCMRT